VADGLAYQWWDPANLAVLPSYLQEPSRRRPVRSPSHEDEVGEESERLAAPWAWLGSSPTAGDWNPPYLIISRVIDLAPAAAMAALDAWWSAHPAPAVIQLGTDRLVLHAVEATRGPFSSCRIRGALSFHGEWRSLRLELGLAAWSASRTELDMRPSGGMPGRRRRRRYFAVGQHLVDRLAGEMQQLTVP
jgi:hypothetical protein